MLDNIETAILVLIAVDIMMNSWLLVQSYMSNKVLVEFSMDTTVKSKEESKD